VLRPDRQLDLARLERTFVLRVNDGLVESFAPRIVARVEAEAPGVRLRFVPKPDKDIAVLRDGAVDLEIGVVGASGPELRVQALFRDRFIAAVRAGHALSRGRITAARYAPAPTSASRAAAATRGPIDDALKAVGLTRTVATTVAGFPAALALARASDLIASVPERHTAGARAGMFSFPLPVATPELVISQIWHPGFDADPAHRWLRACLREVCAAAD
jgi:DNA-binding transcriptional LysR family regulator